MHKKKVHFFKELSRKVKRVFRTRNIIIVSDHKLDHVPLSGIMQVLILVGVLGFFSGVSYLTGSYMNARGVIREKEKTIARTRQEKANINEEMALLKKDLKSFGKINRDMASGSKQLSEHYASMSPTDFNTALETQNGVAPMFSNDKQQMRISYLESRMRDMAIENDQLIKAIRVRTSKKIDLFEDIIASTGLDQEKLEQEATAKTTESGRQNATATTLPPGSQNAEKTVARAKENQGGPYIAYSEKVERENAELLTGVDRMMLLHEIITQLPLDSPVNNAQQTSGFGRRIDPINGRLSIHPGIDFSAPMSSPIAATSAGKVIFAGRKAAYGNAVDIEHSFGIVTRYAHLSKIIAKVGEPVKKGQIIGLEGSTGRSTGPHVHYEVRIDDHPVNPAKFLQAGEYVSQK